MSHLSVGTVVGRALPRNERGPRRLPGTSLLRSLVASSVEPVRHLQEEGVRRVQAEKVAHVAVEPVLPRLRPGPLPPLVPYHEERRPGAILPAQHDVRLELLEVEAAGIARDF